MVSAVRPVLRLTNSGNNLRASPGADSSARDSDIGSNALGRNIDSNGLRNNKPKLVPEQNRQHRTVQQTLAEVDFS